VQRQKVKPTKKVAPRKKPSRNSQPAAKASRYVKPRVAAPRRPTTTPARSARAAPPRQAAPQRRSAPKTSSRGSIAALSSKVGQVASASNVRFSKSALAACAMRCTLSVTDSVGGHMRVVFFKGAYESRLKNSSGRISIRGRVTGSPGNLMMILQGVN
ncbi:hypothetical protein N9D31_03505, partial [Oligoflexaceae bacterium]|nr:hypothetical protein [Oligoflexaceae bacterium]